MTSFSNFHVVHMNPEEMTKAKLTIFLRLDSSLTETTTVQVSDLCGGIANITLQLQYTPNDKVCQLFAKVSQTTGDATYAYSFKFSSEFDDNKKPVLNSKSEWQLIGYRKYTYHDQVLPKMVFVYHMTLELINEQTAPFKELYTDLDLTDFELRSEHSQEAVPVHRSVLAVSSPILMSMVQRNWTEAKQGHVVLPEVSKITLEHFKKYIYLKELPDSPMDCAKLLAMVYLMPELGRNCTIKILDIFKPEDGWDWLEHFVSNVAGHKAYILLAALLKNMNKEKIKALEDYFSKLSISTE